MIERGSKSPLGAFLQPDAWSGGHYELAILLCNRDDIRAFAVMKHLWSFPLIDGPYGFRDREPAMQPKAYPDLGTRQYGLATISNGIVVPCGSAFTRSDDGSDWVQLYFPMGSISGWFPTAGFPFNPSSQKQVWKENVGTQED